jgi:adenosine kinase
VPAEQVVEPTGVGDAFRSGFLAGVAWGLDERRSAQVGSAMATLVIETVGPQEYSVSQASFLHRLAEVYGQDAADEVEPHLRAFRP